MKPLIFFRDTAGNELSPDQTYIWDPIESALRPDPSGPISAREIKLARFLLSNPLSHAEKIENLPVIIPPILDLAKKIEAKLLTKRQCCANIKIRVAYALHAHHFDGVHFKGGTMYVVQKVLNLNVTEGPSKWI